MFRRTWTPSRAAATAAIPLPGVGAIAIDAGTVPRIIQTRAARAGFDPALLGGHSLKRGALPPASVPQHPAGPPARLRTPCTVPAAPNGRREP